MFFDVDDHVQFWIDSLKKLHKLTDIHSLNHSK